jgi:hypothetical protein
MIPASTQVIKTDTLYILGIELCDMGQRPAQVFLSLVGHYSAVPTSSAPKARVMWKGGDVQLPNQGALRGGHTLGAQRDRMPQWYGPATMFP